MGIFKQLPLDANGNPIAASSQISEVLNVSASASTWLPVTTTAECKSMLMKARTNSTFKLATGSGSSAKYITASGAISFNLAAPASTRICFVKAASGTDVVEVLTFK